MVIFLFKRFGKKIALISSCLFIMGFGMSFINVSFNQETYSGVVTEAKENYFILNSKFESLYVHEKNNSYEIGDVLSIKGKKKELDFSLVESQFDFKDYLNKKGIYIELVVEKITVTFSNFVRIKSYRSWFLSHFSNKSRGVISSILFSEHIENEITDNMESLHLARLISASGIYIYAFLKILRFLISRKLNDKWTDIVSIGIMSLYFIFTFPRFAVLKILVIQVLNWINKHLLKRFFNRFEILGITGTIFLLCNYHLAYQDGFVLGFIIPIAFTFIKDAVHIKNKIGNKLVTAFLSYLFFIPFELKFYRSIAPFSFINQLLFTPIFILIGIIGILCFYGLPLAKLLDWIIYPFKWIFKPFLSLNIQIYGPELNGLFLLIYYLIFMALIYYITIGFKPFSRKLLIAYVSFLCVYFLPIKNTISSSVSFINVGQGDACLIRNGNNTAMIDTGGLKYMDLAKDSLIPYFKKERIYKIDLVITTHDDNDHKGALESLYKNFKVGKYVNSYTEFPINFHGIKFINYNNHIEGAKEENNRSLVVGFHFMKKDFLIMGDAPIEIERKMIKEYPHIPCDILKVGHHGSDTSTCDAFIKYLQPKEAVISVGKNNTYGHPHSAVLMILKANKIPIKRTDILGTITYSNYIFM